MNPQVRSLDDSLYAGTRALFEAECVIAEIEDLLSGAVPRNGSCAENTAKIPIVEQADENASRIVSLVTRLRSIRDLISAPKVEPIGSPYSQTREPQSGYQRQFRE